MTFGVEKLEWFGYPMAKKNWKICLFVLTEFTNVMDRQILHGGIGACIASCGNNLSTVLSLASNLLKKTTDKYMYISRVP